MAAIFSVLLLAHGAAGFTPFLRGSRNGGLSMPTPQSTAVYTPPASPVSKFARRASHVALGWAGSTFLSAQHALAATKDMVAPDTWLRFLKPLVAFWVAYWSLIVVLSLLLNKFQLQLKADMTNLDNASKKEITAFKTELTTELTGLKTGVKTELTGLKTELTTELTGLKTGVKTELTELKTELMMLETRITTGIATQLKEILADWKTSSAAEVERQVKTPAQVDRDISAAILKLHNMTMHVTWDEEAEVGMVQATVHRGRLRIAPSSTLDRRSGLVFDLRPNGEALTLSVVQGGIKLLATRDVSVEVFSSKVFNDFQIVNKRFEVLPLSRPPPSSRHPISTLSASLHLTHLLLARQPMNSHPTSIPVPAPAARGCGKRFCHPFAWCGRWTVAVCTRSPVRSSARRQTRGRSSRRPEEL